jgi:hypothetical protein
MLTEYDNPQSRALFRLLIGAAENATASKRNSPTHDRDVARAVAVQVGLPTGDVQRVAKFARSDFGSGEVGASLRASD